MNYFFWGISDDQPPSIIGEPQPAYCNKPACDVGDTVTIYFKEKETIRIRCISSGRPKVRLISQFSYSAPSLNRHLLCSR